MREHNSARALFGLSIGFVETSCLEVTKRVMPAEAGIQGGIAGVLDHNEKWIPACAGMTDS